LALLTRSIRIVGAPDMAGIGCHTMVFEKFKGEERSRQQLHRGLAVCDSKAET
jgi:hypothetical protein